MTNDIIIVGGGIVGLTQACLLVTQQKSLSIVILEAQTLQDDWSESEYHPRVSAIALSSQRIFQSLGVWDNIKAKRVSPFTKIHVWDETEQAQIEFDCQTIAESTLGFIIENNVIQSVLKEKLQQYPQVTFLSSIQLVALKEHSDSIELIARDERHFKAKLAIAADGANSWLRQAAGITLTEHDYDQEAIVATVVTEYPHEKIARQCFLATGPLAFLPLNEANTSSIVWSLASIEAKKLMALDPKEFNEKLENAFAKRLGAVLQVSQRYTFPLRKQQTNAYFKSRVVLVGDAAHTVHPLAGQGANMGLLDAASLAEVIVNAYRKQRDFASHLNLRRYERWRKADNLLMLTGVDAIKHLFASNNTVINKLRSFGVTLTNKISWIKNTFTRHAVGNRAGLPKRLADSD